MDAAPEKQRVLALGEFDCPDPDRVLHLQHVRER